MVRFGVFGDHEKLHSNFLSNVEMPLITFKYRKQRLKVVKDV